MLSLALIWVLDKETVKKTHFCCQDQVCCTSDFMLFLDLVCYQDLKIIALYLQEKNIDLETLHVSLETQICILCLT